MENITLSQLINAVEIQRTHSISQASRNLYVNQSNLSRSIKELEQTLGYSIFERTPRGVITTEKGKIFLSEANEIIQKIYKLPEIGKTEEQEQQLSLKISIPRATYITYAFTEFYKRIQDRETIRIHYSETNSTETVNNVLMNGFDLGIIRYPEVFDSEFKETLRKKNLEFELLWEFHYLVLMSENNPLAGQEFVELSDLENQTELVHGDVYVPFISKGTYNKTSLSGKQRKRIYLYERGSQFDFLRNIDTTYMWVSPLPDCILKKNKLVQKKCPQSITRFRDILLYNNEKKISETTEEFIKLLKETQNALDSKYFGK